MSKTNGVTLAVVGAGVLSLALVAYLGQVDLLPPGPTTDYTEVGEGSDLDIQLEMGTVAAGYDGVPWWDPYPDFGQPLIANAEAFVGHPGFVLGKRPGDPHRGVLWMYRVQLLVLFLGACWLAVGMGLPWWTGPPLVLPLLASPEWQERIGIGHLMVIGLTAWPAAFAAWLAGLRDAHEGRWGRGLWLASLGGGAVALGSLGGGHYPTAFALFALLLASWCWVAEARLSAALVGLMAVPFGLPMGWSEATSWPGEGAVLALLAFGLWRGRSRVAVAAWPLVGFALGLLAVASWRLVPSFVVVKLNWRAASWRSIDVEPVPIAELWSAGTERSVEELLRVPSGVVLPLLVVGLVLLAWRWREGDESRDGVLSSAVAALACASLAAVLLGWSAGRPMHPWRVATLAPGMSAINYPVRLQWLLLVLPGFAWLAWLGSRSWMARVPAWVLPALASGLLGWGWLSDGVLQEYPPAQEADVEVRDTVRGVLLGGSSETLSRTSVQGWIRPHFATGIGFGLIETPSHDLEGLGRGEGERREGERFPEATDAEVRIEGRLDTWRVRAPAGSQVRVAQRDLRGWRCRGGELVVYPEDDELGVPTPGRGNNWLRVRVGDEGEAVCSWRPPGLWVGVLLQLLAWGALGVAWRRGEPL